MCAPLLLCGKIEQEDDAEIRRSWSIGDDVIINDAMLRSEYHNVQSTIKNKKAIL